MKKVKILGAGCSNCQKLYDVVKRIISDSEKQAEFEVEHINDVVQIVKMGVMTTPAIAIDNKIVSSGKIPSAKEIKEFLGIN